MREQTLLRPCISVREIFPNPIPFTVINTFAKGGSAKISTVLVPVHYAAPRSVL